MRRVLLVLLLLPTAAWAAEEEVYVFESEEDAATPPDPLVCAGASFVANVQLGASLWSVKLARRDGRVIRERKRIGRATACLGLTNVMFPEGLVQQFHARFELPQGAYVASGTCTVSSNSVPQPFIILAGCTLKVTSAPAGTLGGMVTSASMFNPLHRPGYSTGSMWTLHEFLSAPRRHHHGHDEDD